MIEISLKYLRNKKAEWDAIEFVFEFHLYICNLLTLLILYFVSKSELTVLRIWSHI